MFLASLAGGPSRALGEADSNPIPLSGSLLFLSHGTLISQTLNLQKETLESGAEVIAEAVNYDPGLWYGSFTAALGEIVYRSRLGRAGGRTISWFSRTGTKLSDAVPTGTYRRISLAPNGKIIAAICGDPEANVCLIHDDGTVTQITHGGINSGLAWTADSSAVSYYTHNGNARFEISLKSLDNEIPGRVLMAGPTSLDLMSWHPDKIHGLIARSDQINKTEFCMFDRRSGKLTSYLPPDAGLSENQDARFSPDGKWVAYSKREGRIERIHIASYPVPSVDYTLPIANGRGPKWTRYGQELCFLGPGDYLYSVTVSKNNGRLHIGTPERLFHPPILPAPWDIDSFDVTSDGNRVLVNTLAPAEPSQLVLARIWQR